ncbi:MAG TPA: tRNA 2-thiocytidine(32) synthetase TtcA [Firmicutes bacterium]|nr:tRNA 2-thiocytidine(32) synthetase TtcA [Bacillota bacterium]
MKKVLGCIRRADEEFKLIQEGDKIAVGVSGGKDSMTLLYALHLYQKFAPVKFELVGITLKLGFPGMDFNPVVEFCQKHNIEYHLVDTQVYDILKENANEEGKIPCSLCSKFKKAILINKAKELGCNKVSMAHHADDAVETLVLNSMFNGYLGTFKPKMYLDKTDVTFIRPLVYCYESDIIQAASRHVPIVPSTCPMDKHTSREDVKQLLKKLYADYPMARQNLLNTLSNGHRVSLFNEANDVEDFNK